MQHAAAAEHPTVALLNEMVDADVAAEITQLPTGRAQKTSLEKVTSFAGIDPDQPLSYDMIEDAVTRFEQAQDDDYTPGSRRTYAARVRKTWKRWQMLQRDRELNGQRGRAPRAGEPQADTTDAVHAEAEPAQRITIPVILRRNLIVELSLPVDLTSREADRLAAVVQAQVVDAPASAGR